MSFAYLALYTGDYLRDTRHLTPLKHGVYLLLLMHCWDQKGPLPLDENECAGIANCRSADEVEALRYIVQRYFVRMDDGIYNRRIQLEIERAQVISAKRKDAGFKGYQAKAKHLPSKIQASASNTTPTPISTPTPNTKDQQQGASAFCLPEDVDPVLWADFVEMRKKIRKPPTDKAKTLIVGKLYNLEKQGNPIRKVLQQSIRNCWQDVFAIRAEVVK